MMEGRDDHDDHYHESEEDPEAAEANCCSQPRKKKNRMIKNKRRFSDDQIRLLENIFESETRLEPRKKLQVARELGLQPRQVAIWFQNKRARWKSKQLEHEYRQLKASYESLASQFESLEKEKQALLIQLRKLSELRAKTREVNYGMEDLGGSKTDYSCREQKIECDPDEKPSIILQKTTCTDHSGLIMSSSHEHSTEPELQHEEERFGVQKLEEQTDGSFGSNNEKWDHEFDSDSLFDQSCSSSHWLDFWT